MYNDAKRWKNAWGSVQLMQLWYDSGWMTRRAVDVDVDVM